MNSNLSRKSVLVTGSGGFIGSALVNELVNQGINVRAFLRYTSRNDTGLLKFLSTSIQNQIEYVFGNLTDYDAVEKAVEGMDIVFHLGALIGIPYSYYHPEEVVTTNVIGTFNILQACKKFNCRLIHTSTSEVYGTAIYTPIDENHPLQAQSPYSASKIGADKLVESFFKSFDVPTITIRPFNTYGPGQSARAVIPTIITQALTQNVIRLGNLEAKRDFTYVDDTVEGFITAGNSEGLLGQTFNLGYGADISIGELAELILSIIGKKIKIEVDVDRLRPDKSEVKRLISDNSSAKNTLKWEPKTNIEEGLRKTITWIGDHLNLYQPDSYNI